MSRERREWATIKARYPDTLLLFRRGDVYTTYDVDATTMRGVLDTATIDYDTADGPIARLLAAGHKVATIEMADRHIGLNHITQLELPT